MPPTRLIHPHGPQHNPATLLPKFSVQQSMLTTQHGLADLLKPWAASEPVRHLSQFTRRVTRCLTTTFVANTGDGRFDPVQHHDLRLLIGSAPTQRCRQTILPSRGSAARSAAPELFFHTWSSRDRNYRLSYQARMNRRRMAPARKFYSIFGVPPSGVPFSKRTYTSTTYVPDFNLCGGGAQHPRNFNFNAIRRILLPSACAPPSRFLFYFLCKQVAHHSIYPYLKLKHDFSRSRERDYAFLTSPIGAAAHFNLIFRVPASGVITVL
ncbi:hypothetical protein C8R43DRAFT_951096 [Mycena crocata]|nr:hypothetical protein C8R43DRAFT_960455 [Mycena crocata]KAJ7151277.1 hypothetical protein C8R43DRAFT_951096 [Mycena crocata]